VTVRQNRRLTADDLTKQLLGCVSEERSTAHQELVQDDSHGPPVHRLPVALAQDHLWGDVLWSATHLERHQHTGSQQVELEECFAVLLRGEYIQMNLNCSD